MGCGNSAIVRLLINFHKFLEQCFLTFLGLRHPYLEMKIFCGTPNCFSRYKGQIIVTIDGTPGITSRLGTTVLEPLSTKHNDDPWTVEAVEKCFSIPFSLLSTGMFQPCQQWRRSNRKSTFCLTMWLRLLQMFLFSCERCQIVFLRVEQNCSNQIDISLPRLIANGWLNFNGFHWGRKNTSRKTLSIHQQQQQNNNKAPPPTTTSSPGSVWRQLKSWTSY